MKYRVSKARVEQFARRWPCFGTPKGFWWETDRQGDLVDIGCTTGLDEEGVVALMRDVEAERAGDK